MGTAVNGCFSGHHYLLKWYSAANDSRQCILLMNKYKISYGWAMN